MVRSVQTIRVVNGRYSEHIQSVHLIMTSGHSVLSVCTVCAIESQRSVYFIKMHVISSSLYKLYKPYTKVSVL